ncbi:protein kinase SNF1 [Purpureocillium lavendulum]|uniref:non-specific serine/threonine protein kinase n=1 Tax=Purpureocillium lavendulum TaxID=1247861 RepID=A0AB34FY41_9HYPO|nr:protein kinase SNF1 [Purpureocillium lavendulum]
MIDNPLAMAPRGGFEDEELTISLSSSHVRRVHQQRHPRAQHAPDAAPDAAAPSASASSSSRPGRTMEHNGGRDRSKAEQRIGAYKIIKTLGEGSFGKVKLAIHNGTGQQVALKIIARKKLISRDMAGRVEREIEYLQLLRHPHIIKLYTVIKTHSEIIMVLEYAGGELFDHIVQHGRMSESEARRFFQQMLCAVEYCHRHKIVHRDLKPENLLLDEHLNVKIADFGLSNIMTDGNFLKTSCGSPNYAAPEVIGGKLYAGPEVDVWSCGVILYVLLVGRLPFDDEHIPSLFAKIARGTYSIPVWMPTGAANLIKKMLVVNPVQRATIEEIRQDPWFVTDLPAYLQPPVEEFLNTGVDPNKAIEKRDIAPNAPVQVQERLHNEVTEKISKTMGYGKNDVEEALQSEEPSAIKDAYMIVRENKMMQVNQNPDALNEVDEASSPMMSMSSARSGMSQGLSPRPYVSKVGILPSSLPTYHKDYMEREKAGLVANQPAATADTDEPTSARTDAEKEEAARRLKPHARSQLKLEEGSKRPQGMTPINPPKKLKPVRWQFGIRSRNAPWEALLCIHKALHKLGATYVPDEDYAQDREKGGETPSGDGSFTDDYDGGSLHPIKRRAKASPDGSGSSHVGTPDSYHVYSQQDPVKKLFIALHMDIQIYEMEQGVYLVDFKCSGYETPDGMLLDEKEIKPTKHEAVFHLIIITVARPAALFELILGDALAHGGGGADAAGDHLLELVDVGGAAPLLVLDHVDAELHLGLLDELAVGAHAVLAVGAGEAVADEGRRVQAGERDELPAVAERGEAADLALHPDGVAVRAVGDGAVDGAVAAALEAVVALTRAGRVPVEEDVLAAEDAAGDGAGLGVALALGLGGVLGLGAGLVGDGRGGVDGGGDGVVEAREAGGGEPLVLDALQRVARLARRLGRHHQVVQRLELGVGRAEDEGVVARVDGRRDERGGLGVGTGDGDEVAACIRDAGSERGGKLTHNVGLRADGDQAANVLADGHEDLAGHVTALLGAGGLVLDVDAGGTLLDEELGELHDGREAAVARVGVGDDGPQVVDVGEGAALRLGRREALLALLAVVEELRHEEVADLVGDGARRESARTLPMDGEEREKRT